MSDTPDTEERREGIEGRDFVILVAIPGAQTAAAGKARFKVPFNMEIIGVWSSALTGPVGADLIFDLNEAGVTLFTTQANRPKIVDGANDTTAANVKTPDDALVAKDAVVTVDVDQIGSGTAGSDVFLAIHCERR
jgi:hypothetical protein